jgi:HlyD family secretion protein
MKQYIIIAALAALAGCAKQNGYDATGTFEATTVTVSAEVSGKIVGFDVTEGRTVSKAEIVCAIDSSALVLQRRTLEQQQKALLSGKPDIQKQLASLKEQIIKQKTELERVQFLLEDDAATQKQFDDVNAQLNILQSQYDAALSSLSKNTASIVGNAAVITTQIDQVDYNIDKCRVNAPVRGVVLAKYAQAGELAVTGKPLLKIGDTDNMYLRAYFTSDQLSKVSVGQKVKVWADFGGDERYEYEGVVSWISSESEFTPKNIQTRSSRANLVYAAKIAVKNDGKLKIGLYGEVEL